MRNAFVGLVFSLACSVAAGCAASAKQVEVKGATADLVTLAGEWEGQYEGTDTGRTGSIKFSLQVGRHTADGEIYLAQNQPLKITFVEVENGQVSGRIDPYTDPVCSCEVKTEFLGLLKGDVVDGTFTTEMIKDGKTMRGNWSVARKGA
jgi:hypothetical protein